MIHIEMCGIKRVAAGVSYHLLNFESAHGDAAAENLLIQGDTRAVGRMPCATQSSS
jgi:hypothetical protein